jgi:hypothetical protein
VDFVGCATQKWRDRDFRAFRHGPSVPTHGRREVGSGFQPAADFPVGVYAGPKPGGSLKGRPHK